MSRSPVLNAAPQTYQYDTKAARHLPGGAAVGEDMILSATAAR